LQGQEPVSGGIDGELVEEQIILQDPPEITDNEPAGYVAPLESSDPYRSGAVLTAYGVQGGVITYEDGSSARFQNSDSAEQAEIVSSLVSESVPQ
jgi:hypothetical protein